MNIARTICRVFFSVSALWLLGYSCACAADLAFSYDSLNRLTSVDYGNGSVITYTYDAAGNRLTYTGTPAVPPTPKITSQPSPQMIFAGNSATFSVTAGGATGYQWQRSIDGGVNWNSLSDGSAFAGGSTATLTVSGVNAGMSGWLFRVVITNANGPTTSTASKLTAIIAPATPGFAWAVVSGNAGLPVTVPRAIDGGVVSVSAGAQHTLFVKSDGTLWSMGANFYGQLGNGSTGTVFQSVPVQVAAGVAAAAAGTNHSMFLKTDGTLWGMGDNSQGQLGDGTTTSHASPVQVMTGVASVALGSAHTLILKKNGTLWSVGANEAGQLGDGTTTRRLTPVQIAGSVASIASTLWSSSNYFVKTDGTLWAMGTNTVGQLGDTTTTARSVPVQVSTAVASVSAGNRTALFVKTNGTLWGMGDNSYGQLGDGTTNNRVSPVQIGTGVAKVFVGSSHAIFFKTDGTLWGMGANTFGELGNGVPGIAPQTIPIPATTGFVAAAAGSEFSMFLRSDGILFAAGDNSEGQLGDRQPAAAAIPVATGVVALSADQPSSNLFVKSDGTLWQQYSGRVSQVAGVSGVVEAFAGVYGANRLYLKGNGSLWSLAADGTSSQIASDVISAGSGASYYAYLKSDGTLWKYGKVGISDPSPADGQVADHVVSFSATGWHFLYVKDDQTLWGMGETWDGLAAGSSHVQFNVAPGQLDGGIATAYASSNAGNQYIKTDGTLWTRGAGWDNSAGPSVQVDSSVLSAAGGSGGVVYLKADGTLRFRSGVVGTLGDVVVVSGGVSSISGGLDGWNMYLQNTGYGTAPGITTQPQSATAATGATVSLQVVATGTGPLSYQWFKDGVALPWARAAQCVIPYSLPTDSGSYTVEVVNSAGTVSSNPVVVTVSLPVVPTITTQPLSAAVFAGGSVTLASGASSSLASVYQWQKNGINIVGATNATLNLTNIQVADAGSYALVVTNAAGSTTSRFARLVVLVPQTNTTVYGVIASPTQTTAGATVSLDYLLTNIGTKNWGSNHYLSIRDPHGTFMAFAGLIGTNAGESKMVNLSFPAPTIPGTYTYTVQGLENGVEFFTTQTTFTLNVLAQAGNSITYNATNFPITATPGSNLIFNYNVTNTGTKSWGTNHFLSLRDGASVYTQFSSLNGVAPGQSKTVNLSFKAPATPGVYPYYVQALESGVEFFTAQANLTLTVLAPQPNAIVYTKTRSQDNVTPGATVSLRYSLNNAGTGTWGASHYASLRDNNGNFLAFVPLAGVTPGGNTTVNFSFVAPTTPGSYSYFVQALEDGVEFFDKQELVTLNVLPLPIANAGTYNTTNFPATAVRGATVNFTHNVTNRGTKTWGASHYLALRDADSTFLGFPSLNGIAPGQSKTVSYSFTAPASPGVYTYHVQGLESGVEFFNEADDLVLIVP